MENNLIKNFKQTRSVIVQIEFPFRYFQSYENIFHLLVRKSSANFQRASPTFLYSLLFYICSILFCHMQRSPCLIKLILQALSTYLWHCFCQYSSFLPLTWMSKSKLSLGFSFPTKNILWPNVISIISGDCFEYCLHHKY